MLCIIKAFLLLSLVLVTTSCTVYTEKQSEALSSSIYAAKDSMDVARIDLADKYVEESTRLVRPPKKRINIQSVYKKNTNTAPDDKTSLTSNAKQRVVVIPEKYRTDAVIVVSSAEYQELLKDKETYEQIKADNASLLDVKKAVDEELIQQMNNRDKMVNDLNVMQKKLIEKDLAILRRNIFIVVLIGSIGAGVYLRLKGIL